LCCSDTAALSSWSTGNKSKLNIYALCRVFTVHEVLSINYRMQPEKTGLAQNLINWPVETIVVTLTKMCIIICRMPYWLRKVDFTYWFAG
jgi:hypothetical protein